MYVYVNFHLHTLAHFGGPVVSGNKNIPVECFCPKVPAAESELLATLDARNFA